MSEPEDLWGPMCQQCGSFDIRIVIGKTKTMNGQFREVIEGQKCFGCGAPYTPHPDAMGFRKVDWGDGK